MEGTLVDFYDQRAERGRRFRSEKGGTHNPPSRKIPETRNFLCVRSFSAPIIGSGIETITMSSNMSESENP